MAKDNANGRSNNLEPYKFQPGKSGNPSGKSKRYEEIRTVARQYSPKAIKRLVELIGSKDERVALLASREVLDRGFGRPKPTDSSGSDQGQLIVNIVRFSETDCIRGSAIPRQSIDEEGVEVPTAGIRKLPRSVTDD